MTINNIAHTVSNISREVDSTKYIVERIERKLNETESIKHKLRLFLESPDSLGLADCHREFLIATVKGE